MTTDMSLKERDVSLLDGVWKSDNLGKSQLCEALALQYRDMSHYLPIEPQFGPQGFKSRNGSAHLSSFHNP